MEEETSFDGEPYPEIPEEKEVDEEDRSHSIVFGCVDGSCSVSKESSCYCC